MGSISVPVALAAGLVSFLSPCVLPLVPAYLAYLGRRAGQPALVPAGPALGRPPLLRSDLVGSGLAFVAGLSLVFILFFYAFRAVLEPHREVVTPVAGALVILMALQTAGVLRLPWLMREFRVRDQAPRQGGVAGGFLLGMSFAAGWTPCIGATLGAVLTAGINEGTSAAGLVLMVAYCAGLGLPFVAMALAFERAAPGVRALNRHRRLIDLTSAGILLIMGILLLTNNLLLMTQQLSRLLPSWLLQPFGL
jgi:cytochrome c-type biogenesis protein